MTLTRPASSTVHIEAQQRCLHLRTDPKKSALAFFLAKADGWGAAELLMALLRTDKPVAVPVPAEAPAIA